MHEIGSAQSSRTQYVHPVTAWLAEIPEDPNVLDERQGALVSIEKSLDGQRCGRGADDDPPRPPEATGGAGVIAR